jgi:hypothetical protein
VIEPRVCVATWNEYSIALLTGWFVPDNRDTVGDIITGNAAKARGEARANLFQSNHTDAGDTVAVMQLEAERRRQ